MNICVVPTNDIKETEKNVPAAMWAMKPAFWCGFALGRPVHQMATALLGETKGRRSGAISFISEILSGSDLSSGLV